MENMEDKRAEIEVKNAFTCFHSDNADSFTFFRYSFTLRAMSLNIKLLWMCGREIPIQKTSNPGTAALVLVGNIRFALVSAIQ